MTTTTEKSFEETEPGYFGECPICLRNDEMLHVGRDEYCVCHTHKFKWLIGSNLFSGWRHMTEGEFRKNWELIKTYKEIEPIMRWREWKEWQEEWKEWQEARKKAESRVCPMCGGDGCVRIEEPAPF